MVARTEQLQFENENLLNAAMKGAQKRVDEDNLIKEMKGEITWWKHDSGKTKAANKKLQEKCDVLQEKHKAQESALQAMSYTLNQTRNENESVEKITKEYKDVCSELEITQQKRETEMGLSENLRREVTALRTACSQSLGKYEKTREKYDLAASKLKEVQKRVAELQGVEDSLAALEQKHSTEAAVNVAFRLQHADCANALAKARETEKHAREKYVDNQYEVVQLRQRLDVEESNADRCREYQQQLEELMETNEGLTKRVKQQKKEVRLLSDERIKVYSDFFALATEGHILRSQSADKDEEIDQLHISVLAKEKLVRRCKDYRQQVNGLQEEISKMRLDQEMARVRRAAAANAGKAPGKGILKTRIPQQDPSGNALYSLHPINTADRRGDQAGSLTSSDQASASRGALGGQRRGKTGSSSEASTSPSKAASRSAHGGGAPKLSRTKSSASLGRTQHQPTRQGVGLVSTSGAKARSRDANIDQAQSQRERRKSSPILGWASVNTSGSKGKTTSALSSKPVNGNMHITSKVARKPDGKECAKDSLKTSVPTPRNRPKTSSSSQGSSMSFSAALKAFGSKPPVKPKSRSAGKDELRRPSGDRHTSRRPSNDRQSIQRIKPPGSSDSTSKRRSGDDSFNSAWPLPKDLRSDYSDLDYNRDDKRRKRFSSSNNTRVDMRSGTDPARPGKNMDEPFAPAGFPPMRPPPRRSLPAPMQGSSHPNIPVPPPHLQRQNVPPMPGNPYFHGQADSRPPPPPPRPQLRAPPPPAKHDHRSGVMGRSAPLIRTNAFT